MRIAVVEPSARGGLIHYAYMLCRGLCREGAREGGRPVEVTLITGRSYELAGLPHAFRVEPILRLWDPKPEGRRNGPEAPRPGTGSRSDTGRTGGSRLGSGSPRDGLEQEPGLRRLASNVPGPPGRAASGPFQVLLESLLRVLRRSWRAVIWYREWVRLALRLRRLAPDVVQIGDVRFPGDLAGLWLLRLLGLRLADVCHNVEPFAGGRFARPGARGRAVRWIYRRIYRCFDVVFVHYRINREAFLRLYGLPPGRVRAIPLGDGSLFRELRQRAADPPDGRELRRRLGLPAAAPVILLFGTLSPYKGTDVLLEAFASLREVHPEARLVLAGFPLDGFDPEGYRQRARTLGLPADSRAGAAVTVVPEYLPSEEVAGWMELATVAVFPYREIYQSATLQVALTFGVPTVATRVGAVPEVVRDGETGLLVPPEDAPALAAALGRLLERPELARRLGERAAEDQRLRCGWDRVARRVLAAYRELLDESAEGGAT